MKRILVVLMALMLTACKASDQPEIGVIQLVDHTSLNLIYDAFLTELKENGYDEDDVVYMNAANDTANISNAVSQMESNDTKVVVAITTPVAQYCYNLAKTKPVIFSAVTDPIAAGLLDDLQNPNHNITGTSDAINIKRIMDLARTFNKDAKTIGFIYNPGESNSVSNLEKLQNYCKEKDLALEVSAVSTSSELKIATETLCDKVDFIFVANDNTVAEGMKVVSETAITRKKMVFVGADSMVMDGGVATVGIDYEELGKETARMVIDVLNGKDVKNIPVKVFDDLNVYVNVDTCKRLGIDIPKEILNDPKYIEITNE